MKVFQFLILVCLAGFLVAAALKLPPRGEIGAPVQQEYNARGTEVAGSYYIQNAYKDAHTPNMVAVILADYRAFDTLGETIVVFAGAIGCFFILRRRP
ncbi:MAG: hydrogen gas-evolving membrane-bound hydrogenase subunit E [Desulfonatronovibrionaceae bacterium]